MSIRTALEARRAQLNEREAGFTLIELLVVVIIIGVLAAIAIPVYVGIQNNAKNSALQSDLTNAKTALVAYYSDKNLYTTTVADLKPYGYTQGTYSNPGVAPVIALSGSGTTATFCVSGTSNAGTAYKITADTAAAPGSC